ncbi:MAG: hypothetical protein ACI8UO_005755 [Verrucomicrobiales bacterium]|jgi:hypothetical protein
MIAAFSRTEGSQNLNVIWKYERAKPHDRVQYLSDRQPDAGAYIPCEGESDIHFERLVKWVKRVLDREGHKKLHFITTKEAYTRKDVSWGG